jgi:uncharacterized protein with HEPN domain
MSRDFTDYLNDILSSIDEIFDFIGNMEYDAFSSDKKTINAVIRSLEIIGEASKHIPNNIKTGYPDVPWKRMSGMRDKLIHEYHGVDYEMVWLVIREDLREVKEKIMMIINSGEK